MLTDIEIAQKAKLKHIESVAKEAGFLDNEIELYGRYKAKINLKAFKRLKDNPNGKLILVTAMSPTPAGEGKTTTTIGLGEAFYKLGKKAFICIREPSLGPCMGVKGGAAGGGYSQVLPMDEINLHFTGDMHQISSAHNLLAAMIDNHIHQGNTLEIDPKRVLWHRVVDMNDRALRRIKIGLSEEDGVTREDEFAITAASEVMAIVCLAQSITDLKERLAKIVVAFSKNGKPIYTSDIKAHGAMALLLKDTIKPNIVQTIEGTPAFVHGGPFANIAHGCNALLATKLALKVSDYVITEAGFGADLGAEKFFDIKCRLGDLKPDAVVLVATMRALKRNAGVELDKVYEKNSSAVEKGLANLLKHIENLKLYKVPIIVSINEHETDCTDEQSIVEKAVESVGVKCIVNKVWEKGGEGGIELAETIAKEIEKNKNEFKFLYDVNQSIHEKLEKIAKSIYGADSVEYTPEAEKDIEEIAKIGLDKLPICVAKTQYSFSDDPKLLGAPKGFNIKVRQLRLSNGAGFIVAYTGKIMTMPALPKHPAAENMDIDENEKIKGLF